MRYFIYLLAMVLIPGAFLFGQSGSNQNNSDLKKATNDLKKSVQGFGQLFKKKKSDSATSTSNNTVADNASQPSQPNTTVNNQPATKSSNNQGMKAGDIMPGAKYIDADEFSPFNNGAAIIRKGTSYALIDTRGNFIIPFNVYSHLSFGPINNYGYTNGFNGLFSYTKPNGETGILNATGKVLATSMQGKNAGYADNNSMIQITDVSRGANLYIFMDANGKSYPLKQPIQFIQEGIGQFNTNAGTVFIKLTGEALTSAAFADVTPFANGMSIVSSTDQFGQRKYGYLNREGKLAIPFNFSIKPGLFASGYAKVEPKDKGEFEYAFINKQGNIVLKQTLADVNKYGKFGDFKTYGLAFSQFYVLDSTLKITSLKDFFKGYGIVDENIWYTNNAPVMNESNPKIYYSYSHARNLMDNSTIGFIHLKTGKVVSPVFELPAWSSINYFDPVSHLLYAKVCTARDASHNNAPIYREGYVNEDGYFVILKGSGSKW
jgi:hypothetical protein